MFYLTFFFLLFIYFFVNTWKFQLKVFVVEQKKYAAVHLPKNETKIIKIFNRIKKDKVVFRLVRLRITSPSCHWTYVSTKTGLNRKKKGNSDPLFDAEQIKPFIKVVESIDKLSTRIKLFGTQSWKFRVNGKVTWNRKRMLHWSLWSLPHFLEKSKKY